jgi:hypothetical protein
MISNLDRNADYPFHGCYLRRFPRFARTIVLDKRRARACRGRTLSRPDRQANRRRAPCHL